IMTEESHSRPGDYVALRALSDLVCVSTACPDDIDPINGWNPTDIHVRIYKATAPIKRAIAYRPKEDAAMTTSRESAFHPRIAALTPNLSPARDIWAPTSFPATGSLGEYWACRERVTLQDMSGLRKYDIVGPDAEHVLQRLTTRDLSRVAQWRGTYALMCDETGAVVDDGTLFRLGPALFRWCCGSEESARRIETLAAAEGLQVRLVDMSKALVNVSLQGPKSREVLADIVFTQPHVPAFEQLRWFGVTVARLGDRDGAPFMLSRTGYTGELGYEVFCTQSDALRVWDAMMEAGDRFGITPMGSEALDTVRIEAGLAASGAEFGTGHDAYEAGLGFAVDLRKPDFVGKDALVRNADAPRRTMKGLLFKGNDTPLPGAPVTFAERQVGEVTSATRSPMLGRGIAMARLAVEHAANETILNVGMMDGRMKLLPATVVDIPFVDPKRERARA
ncbi:MAG: glycine cleavage T C-terminal barrel domain-containing protein, partial [Pseudomonadota bacterium]